MKKIILKNYSRILSCLFSILSVATLNAQSLDWVKQVDGQGYEMSNAIAVDLEGNVYTTGTFNQVTDFDPGPGVQNLTPIGGNDIFVLKLNAAGAFVWAQQIGGSGTDENSKGIAVDTSGNVYITGDFIGTVDFDPGSDTFDMSTTDGSNYPDVFVLKLNEDGSLSWARQYIGSSQDRGYGITVDQDGNIYTTGYFGLSVDFNPGTGSDSLTSVGGLDVYVCKLSNDGDYIWAKSFGGINGDIGYAVATDNSGNVYITGGFPGTVDFDPGIGVFQLVSVGDVDIFVSKLDIDGNFVWAKQMGGGFSIGRAISLDVFGNVYTTGFFGGVSDFDSGPGTFQMQANGENAVFITKFNTSGDFVWAKNIGGFDGAAGNDITIDAYANVYTTGRFFGSADFDPSDTGTYDINAATGATFVSKLDSAGNFVWAINMGEEISSLALDPIANLYTTGQFYGTTDFDPGTDTLSLSPTGISDIFVLKLNNCNPLSTTINITTCDTFQLNGISYSQTGSYQQAYVTANGCDSTVMLDLVIHHSPDVAVTQTGTTLAAVATGLTYQWIDCDNGNNFIPGATQQTYTAANAGRYAVIVTKNDCSDTSICYDISGTGIQDKQTNNFVKVYPNPASEKLIVTTTKILRNAKMILMNIIGQSIIKQVNVSGNNFSLDLSGCAAGTYILEIEADGEVSRSKIIKEN